jgi:hypothetical protein
MPTTPRPIERSGLLIAIALLLILLPFGYSAASRVVAGNHAGPQPFLEKPAPGYDRCIRDTTYMRFHHWELLKTVRDDVVRSGHPGDVALKKCRGCHTSRERFCDRCHTAVSLQPDCWGCHYYP